MSNGGGQVAAGSLIACQSRAQDVPGFGLHRVPPSGGTHTQAFLGDVIEITDGQAWHRKRSR
jgi:hypothetical protein